jgi:hypothetical protein
MEINDRGNPLHWPRNTLYPQKSALLRQQGAVARSVGIVRSRTKATEFSLCLPSCLLLSCFPIVFLYTFLVSSARVKYHDHPILIDFMTLILFLSLLSLFWKNKSRHMRSLRCLCVSLCFCVCVSPLLTFECLNQSLWNMVSILWHLSPSKRLN